MQVLSGVISQDLMVPVSAPVATHGEPMTRHAKFPPFAFMKLPGALGSTPFKASPLIVVDGIELSMIADENLHDIRLSVHGATRGRTGYCSPPLNKMPGSLKVVFAQRTTHAHILHDLCEPLKICDVAAKCKDAVYWEQVVRAVPDEVWRLATDVYIPKGLTIAVSECI